MPGLSSVASDVVAEFVDPEIAVVFRRGARTARSVSVPEAAVDEQGSLRPRGINVGGAGEPLGVGPESVTLSPQDRPHDQLRGRTLLAHPCHQEGALRRSGELFGAHCSPVRADSGPPYCSVGNSRLVTLLHLTRIGRVLARPTDSVGGS